MRSLLLLMLLGLAGSGCMSAELARVRRDVGRDLPTEHLAGGHAFQFGRLTMGLARGFVGSNDPQAAAALRAVRGVAVGTYALRGPLDAEALDLTEATARIQRRGWQPVVISRDDGEATFVYARTKGDALRDLLVVTFEDDAMTLVRVSGRFDATTLAALAKDDGGPLSALDGVLDHSRADG